MTFGVTAHGTLAREHARLVGRAEELSSLDRLLDGLGRDGPNAVQIAGEPGIGKTRLLRELAERAELRGYLVLSGSASELEHDFPFSVLVDALDEYVESVDPSELAILDDAVRGELAHVFPSLSAVEAGSEVTLQHERYRTHRAVRALLERLAATRPLVLVLDDLHWSDSASVEVLGALLRRPPSAPVLLGLALRPRQVPERLGAALERALRAEALIRFELGALTPVEARELLDEAIGDVEARALYEESGGNPFYLEQLARSFERSRPERDGSDSSTVDIGVPSAVAAALGEELAALSERDRVAIEGAAVAGDPFELELAAAAAAMPEAEAMDAIDELLRLDLVRTTDVPRRFRFRHPLVRRTVYVASAAGSRLRAHERCADELAARGAGPLARAHHVARSACAGDLDAVAVMRQAGEAALRLAPASAARWFAEALRLLPDAAPAEDRVELLRARAGALSAAGNYADSHEALTEALAIVPDSAHALHARLTRVCAAVESNLGRHEDARRRLADELAQLTDPGSADAVTLTLELTMKELWLARYDDMHAFAERAVTAARQLGDAPLIAAALAARAFANAAKATEQPHADISEAAAIFDSLTNEQLSPRLEAAVWLAGAELYIDRYAQAAAHASRALAVSRATGQGEFVIILVQTLGSAWRGLGRLVEAGELLDGGIEAARLLDNTHALVWNLANRSAVALDAGDVELALATAEESVDLSSLVDDPFVSAGAALRLAAALQETGRPEAAVDLLLARAGGEEIALIPGNRKASALELLTRCLLSLERVSDAERAVGAAAAWATAMRIPLAVACASRAAAAVALHRGDAAAAADAALRSAATASEAEAPIEAALSRTLAGRALAAAGERERAVEELRRAVAELDACGAVRYRGAAEHELERLVGRVHRRTRRGKPFGHGVETLTGRELEVARLVVDRRTNPQIAAQLFVSNKTVETHLRNIFRKLNIASRVELARTVERADQEARTADHPH